jgi:ribonuclease HI
MKRVQIYTDGACSGNPGIGGWGALLIYNGQVKEISGYEEMTTNNRMELKGVIMALAGLKEPCKVIVYSDSAYTVNAINNNWLNFWQINGWRTADKKEVKNQDLWRDLASELKKHDVEFIKVKGHADNVNNNRCDALARAAIKNYKDSTAIKPAD